MMRDVVEERFGLAAWSGPATPMRQPHRHDDLEINVALGGRLRYRLPRGEVEIPDGSAALFWAGVPHQLVEAEDGAVLQWATVPTALVARWGLGDVERLLDSPVPVVVEAAAPLPEGWPSELASGDEILSSAVELEARAIVLRIARSSGTGVVERGVAPAVRMARFMSTRFTEPLTVQDVAAAAGLGPSQAMAVFRRDYGTTIGAYLVARRVDEARRLLRSTTYTTDRVLLAAGFGSVSAGYEAFRRATGEPPARWRRRRVVEQSEG